MEGFVDTALLLESFKIELRLWKAMLVRYVLSLRFHCASLKHHETFPSISVVFV